MFRGIGSLELTDAAGHAYGPLPRPLADLFRRVWRAVLGPDSRAPPMLEQAWPHAVAVADVDRSLKRERAGEETSDSAPCSKRRKMPRSTARASSKSFKSTSPASSLKRATFTRSSASPSPFPSNKATFTTTSTSPCTTTTTTRSTTSPKPPTKSPFTPLSSHLLTLGTHPLLPQTWSHDFPTLPASLFTPHPHLAPIHSLGHRPAAHGMRALAALLDVGPRARDARRAKRAGRGGLGSEGVLRRGVQGFARWAGRDGGVRVCGEEGVLCFVTGGVDVDAGVLYRRMVARLERMEGAWRSRRRGKKEVEGCYGVVISGTVLAIVALADEEEGEGDGEQEGEKGKVRRRGLRTIGYFDFGEEGRDVWNALAVALLVVHCRRLLVEAREETGKGKGVKGGDGDGEDEADPDA